MKISICATLVCALFCCACKKESPRALLTAATEAPVFKDGDLIFHKSKSSQSLAIQLATHSPYSHCGILYQNKGKWEVLEAVQPVKTTPLNAWIKRGEKGHYVVKRLKDEHLLDPTKLKSMKTAGAKMLGKSYDLAFDWSDEKIYCSELIWKIYKEGAGIELCPLQRLRDFDLTNPVVQQKLKERYGKNIPLDEPVVPPSALFESALLEVVR